MAKKSAPKLFAIIHIGSEQVTLQISEYSSLGDLRVIEKTSREVFLGEETFKNGADQFYHFGTALRLVARLQTAIKRVRS